MRFLKGEVKLLAFEMRDSKTRKAVFREAGKTYKKWESTLTDRPGAIARLMEMAFNAGVASSASLSTEANVDTLSARMHDIDVRALSREILEDFRRYQVGIKPDNTPPKLEQYAFILERGLGVPGRLGRDRWLECGSRSDRSRSTKVIGPLKDLGLFEEWVLAFPDGTEVDGLIITEWGLELLLTGSTLKPEHRQVGGSTTYPTYVALKEHQPLPRNDGMITIWDLDSSAAAFVLDHRVNGIGRPERLDGGACVEDIAYFLEVLELSPGGASIERRRLYRPNPAIMPLIGRLEQGLLDSGILLAEDEGRMIISEWGYELICTGETAAPKKRSVGNSSTYRKYHELLSKHIE